MGFKPRRAASDDFQEVFLRLRSILAKHSSDLSVKHDTDADYYVESTKQFRGRELFFGGVRKGKAYVSYHLFPVYMMPALLSSASPELRARMQGKSCFNFTRVDDSLLDELATLTRRGFDALRDRDLV